MPDAARDMWAADAASAMACNSHGPVNVASGFSIDFLVPGRLGQTLYADARGRSRTLPPRD